MAVGDQIKLTYTLPNNLREKPTTVGLTQDSLTTYNIKNTTNTGTLNQYSHTYNDK